MAKTIIECALTGAITPKEIAPDIPTTPKEIAEDAVRVWKAGASIVHIHTRDENQRGCMDPKQFKEICERIRDNTDLVLNLTTAGGPTPTEEARWEHVLENLPEMCSYDCGSFNWLPGDRAYLNEVPFLQGLGKVCIENKIRPEIEIFDVGQINAAKWFFETGYLEAPMYFDFVLGVLGASQATPQMVEFMKDMLPEGSNWTALGIGKDHLPILYTAIVHGGHVRVGLEDNVYYAKGVKATNEQLVARAARVIKEFNNEVATPDETRQILRLGKYYDAE